MANGYVILTSGDTLFGKIKKQSPFVLAEFVVFQKNETTPVAKYYPAQLRKYYFEGSNYYVSDSVPFRKVDEFTTDVWANRHAECFWKKKSGNQGNWRIETKLSKHTFHKNQALLFTSFVNAEVPVSISMK